MLERRKFNKSEEKNEKTNEGYDINDYKKDKVITKPKRKYFNIVCFFLFEVFLFLFSIIILCIIALHLIRFMGHHHDDGNVHEFKEYKVEQNSFDIFNLLSHDNPHLSIYLSDNTNVTNPCDSPYNTICGNYKGILMEELVNKSISNINQNINKIIIKNKNDSIYINEIFIKKETINYLHSIFNKCMENDEKILFSQILNNENIKNLFKIVEDFEDFENIGKVMGMLSSYGINIPIKLNVKGHLIENTISKKILSLEMSGNPLSYIYNDETIKNKDIFIEFLNKYMIVFLNVMGKNKNLIERYIKIYEDLQKMLTSIGLFIKIEGKKLHPKKNNLLYKYDKLSEIFKVINITDFFLHSKINETLYKNKEIEINTLNFFKGLDSSIKKYSIKKWKIYFIINIIFSNFKWFDFILTGELKIDNCLTMLRINYPITLCKIFKSIMSKSIYHDKRLSFIKKIKIHTKILIKKYIDLLEHNPKVYCLTQKSLINKLKDKLNNIKIYVCKCSSIDSINERTNITLPSIEKYELTSLKHNFENNVSFIDIIFFNNIFETKRLETNDDYNKYYKDLYYYFTADSPFYHKVFKNQLILPPAMFVFPNYSNKFELWQLYAGVIATISHETSHMIDDFLGENKQSTFDEIKCYESQIECIIKLYGNNIISESTWFEDKADILGIYVSYHAWIDQLEQNPSSRSLYNYKQHFFIYYYQKWCSNHNDIPKSHSTNRIRLELSPVMLKQEFKTVFNCNDTFFYNKKNKCLL